MSNLDRIIKLEVLKSRIFLIILQYITNVLIPDHQNEVFHFPKTNQNDAILDRIIFHLLGGFLRWDAQYFMHISIYGYSYENTVAFFPFVPIVVGIAGKTIHYCIPFISLEAVLLLLYVIFNVLIFQWAAIELYKLTCWIFGDMTIGKKTVLLFCYNPASIFFIAPYTECLYSLFTFRALLCCMKLYKTHKKYPLKLKISDFQVILEIGLSTLIRSNGILNIGFIVFTFICLMNKTLPSGIFSKILHIIKYTFVIAIFSIVSFLPFLIYQLYCYKRFCTTFVINLPEHVKNYGTVNNFVLPGEFHTYNQSWCFDQFPLAYSYVQDHYWNVGFFRYYQFKQIPNFMLAAPIISILLINCFDHLKRNVFLVFTLSYTNISNKPNKINIVNPILNAVVVHAFVLSLFCLFFIHVQVSTRMLCSASPLFYWYCSQSLSDSSVQKNSHNFFYSNESKKELLLKIYFFSYFVVGTLLFCNFLPWT